MAASILDEVRSWAADVPNTEGNYVLSDAEAQLVIDRLAFRRDATTQDWFIDLLEAGLEYARVASNIRADENPERAQVFRRRVDYLQLQFAIKGRSFVRSTRNPETTTPETPLTPSTEAPGSELEQRFNSHVGNHNAHHTPPDVSDFATEAHVGDALAGALTTAGSPPVTLTAGDVAAGTSTEHARQDHNHLLETYNQSPLERYVNGLITAHPSGGGRTRYTDSEADARVDALVEDFAKKAQTATKVPVAKLPTASGSQAGIIQPTEYALIHSAIDGATLDRAPHFSAENIAEDDDFMLHDASQTQGGASQFVEATVPQTRRVLLRNGADYGSAGEVFKKTASGYEWDAENFIGALDSAPTVEVGKVYYNAADHRFYEGINQTSKSNTLRFSLTPAAEPSTPSNLQGSGFSVGRVVTYGTSPLTGWNDFTLQVQSGQYYLEVATSQDLFTGLSMTVGANTFTFRRDSSTQAGGDIWTSNDASASPWQLGVAVDVVVHATNAPFSVTSDVWHYLPIYSEDHTFNALTDVELTSDNQLRFEQHTGPAHDIDLSEFKQASWADEDDTSFIPASKIHLSQTLIDGTGIGITLGNGQTARGPLRLFSPTWDLDDSDKTHGIFYARVDLTIVDADATTSFSSTSVVRTFTETARIRASVLRQDDNEYQATGGNQGELIGASSKAVYRSGVLVGRIQLRLAHNSDNELGYYVDWNRSSGASSISFQLNNFSVEFTHNDISEGGGVAFDASVQTTLNANLTLNPNTNNEITALRQTIAAGKGGTYLISLQTNINLAGLTRDAGAGTTVYFFLRDQNNEEHALNSWYFVDPNEGRTISVQGWSDTISDNDVLTPVIAARGGSTGGTFVLSGSQSPLHTFLRLKRIGD